MHVNIKKVLEPNHFHMANILIESAKVNLYRYHQVSQGKSLWHNFHDRQFDEANLINHFHKTKILIKSVKVNLYFYQQVSQGKSLFFLFLN